MRTLKIALKEIRESNYWLRIIHEIKTADSKFQSLIYSLCHLFPLGIYKGKHYG